MWFKKINGLRFISSISINWKKEFPDAKVLPFQTKIFKAIKNLTPESIQKLPWERG